jgi:hypothetical protein
VVVAVRVGLALGRTRSSSLSQAVSARKSPAFSQRGCGPRRSRLERRRLPGADGFLLGQPDSLIGFGGHLARLVPVGHGAVLAVFA